MKKYEQLDILGDVGLRVWGKDLEELFENAASGMSELITDTSMINETEKRDVILHSDNNENLLVQWLNELIFLFDAYGFIGKIFTIKLNDKKLKAEITGGSFEPGVHESRLLIKAATYHKLRIEKTDDTWEAEVIFDI